MLDYSRRFDRPGGLQPAFGAPLKLQAALFGLRRVRLGHQLVMYPVKVPHHQLGSRRQRRVIDRLRQQAGAAGVDDGQLGEHGAQRRGDRDRVGTGLKRVAVAGERFEGFKALAASMTWVAPKWRVGGQPWPLASVCGVGAVCCGAGGPESAWRARYGLC